MDINETNYWRDKISEVVADDELVKDMCDKFKISYQKAFTLVVFIESVMDELSASLSLSLIRSEIDFNIVTKFDYDHLEWYELKNRVYFIVDIEKDNMFAVCNSVVLGQYDIGATIA